MRKNILVLLHIIAWLCFLPSPFLLYNTVNSIPVAALLANTVLPVVFYINYLFAVPALYLRKNKGIYFLSMAAVITGFLAIHYTIDHSLLAFAFARISAVFLFSYLLARHDEQHKKREGQLGTELFMLKAQINPHFLFNTLNNIYALTLEQSEKAPDVVVKLASLMRYATETNRELIPLEDEMTQVKNYIALYRIRLTSNVELDISMPQITAELHIARFILIPFIEYIFSRGVNSEGNSKLFIYFVIENDTLILKTESNKVFVQSEVEQNASASMVHAMQRLDLLYAGRYSLDKSERNNVATLLLKIKLK